MPPVTSYAPGMFCWADLATPDADAAKAFYTGLFGWTTVDSPTPAGVYVLLMKNGERVAALYENKEVPPHWLNYINVESVDVTTKTAKDLGANVHAGPFEVGDVGRMSLLADPEGAMIALWEPRTSIGATVRDEANTLCWHELASRDSKAAAAFYSALVGWDAQRHEGGFAYTEVHAGGRAVGGMYDITPEMGPMPPNWIPYFMVDDCDETVATAISLRGGVMMPPKTVEKVGRFAVIRDPGGAMFSVITLEPH
jgi:predicted enzyme related to lactoylglutathione lyase